MKKFLGFVATAIAIALADYFTDIKLIPLVLSGIWHGLSWCWNALVSSYALPGWVLLIIVTIGLLVLIYAFLFTQNAPRKPTSVPEPAYKSYVQDTMFGAKWRWQWLDDEIWRLWGACPVCEGVLVFSISAYSEEVHFICEHCNNSVKAKLPGWDRDDALDFVKREIVRRINSGEFKRSVNTAS